MSAAGFLQIESGPERDRRFPLAATGLSIGRQAGNDLALNDQQVSRQHARIEVRDGQVVVTDLGTANGTYVNDQRIEGTVPLRSGDIVTVGETTIRFVADMTATVVATPTPVPPPQPGPPVYTPPPLPATPATGQSNRRPLIIGAVIIAVLLFCICIGCLFALSRSSGSSSQRSPYHYTMAVSFPPAGEPGAEAGTAAAPVLSLGERAIAGPVICEPGAMQASD
jgi:pSer/pThr/pTyr-binding forkhead associated (FHA) protein